MQKLSDIKVSAPSAVTSSFKTSLARLRRKEVKKNVSIPLGPSLLRRWDMFCDKYNFPRAELMRFALEYVLENDEFISIVKDVAAMPEDELDGIDDPTEEPE
jgi:hypothetical protein